LKKIIHSLLMPPSKHYRDSSFKQVVPVSYYSIKNDIYTGFDSCLCINWLSEYVHLTLSKILVILMLPFFKKVHWKLVTYVQTNNNISQWVFLSLIINPLDKIYVICHLFPQKNLRKYSLNSLRELSTKSVYKKSYSE
jgi:hypothetical protein